MRFFGHLLVRAEAVVVGAVVVVALLLINGGYVYKTTCPLASGGAQTTWTYGIDDIVPYIRHTDPPCYSHTGTRLALSWIGVAPLGHSAKPTATTSADQAAAESLRVATSAITAEYARERKIGASLEREAKAKGLTAAVRKKTIDLMNGVMAAAQGIKDKLDRPIQASDPQLIDARKSLSRYLGYEISIDQLVLTSSSSKEALARANAEFGSKLNEVVSRLRYLSVVIETRYPQVKDWGFLPAK